MKSSFSFNSLLAVGFLTCASIAQVPPQTPTEFKTLKTRYKSDVQTALQPLRVRYIAALEALLRSTTKSGDLDAALAVQRELDLTKGKNSTAPGGKVTLEDFDGAL